MTEQPGRPSSSTVALTIVGAAVVAAIVMVFAVLPAEYGIDPTGIGERLGLTQLATAAAADPLEPLRPGANTPHPVAFKRDVKEFTLGPFEGMEYKYRVDQKGAAFVYAWTASGTVQVDFHGEPDGAEQGFAEFYEQLEAATQAQGTFIAPAPGIHGWYWENQGAAPVTVRLISAGFYSSAIEFRSTGRTTHDVLTP